MKLKQILKDILQAIFLPAMGLVTGFTISRCIKAYFNADQYWYIWGILAILILSIQFSFAQSPVSTEQFIDRFSYVAVHEMALFGIPASVTLAQGILESDSGNSKLAKKNNFFGIVCHQHTYDCAGHCMWINSSTDKNRFRIYPNAWYGFRSRSLKLYTEPRYRILFENHPNDYVAWCVALQKGGWATDPNYTHKLVQIIEKYQLWKYDIKTF